VLVRKAASAAIQRDEETESDYPRREASAAGASVRYVTKALVRAPTATEEPPTGLWRNRTPRSRVFGGYGSARTGEVVRF
jgi:hypothetical protein